ncbi:MAG: hypothetical protein AB7H92_03795 [Microbacteriaceae bacterium]
MNLYRTLDATYAPLSGRTPPTAWRTGCATYADIVAVIRDDRPDPAPSDAVLRHLLLTDHDRRDASTVVLHALAPALRARLGRAVTDEYRSDALTDLAFVLLDADHATLDRPGLAHRLVNRAHTRAHKAAQRAYQRGAVQPVTIAPTDPARLGDRVACPVDVAEVVATHVDLCRFLAAAEAAVHAGDLSSSVWAAYRNHRLARAVDPDHPACGGVQRKLASRAATRIQPLVDTYLHAA